VKKTKSIITTIIAAIIDILIRNTKINIKLRKNNIEEIHPCDYQNFSNMEVVVQMNSILSLIRFIIVFFVLVYFIYIKFGFNIIAVMFYIHQTLNFLIFKILYRRSDYSTSMIKGIERRTCIDFINRLFHHFIFH